MSKSEQSRGEEDKDSIETRSEDNSKDEGEDGGQIQDQQLQGSDKVQLERKLEEKQEEIDRWQSLAQRVKADFENYKKKRQEQEETIKRRAKEKLLKKLLDPLDSLRSALDLSVEAQSSSSLQELKREELKQLIRGFYEGLETVLQQFQQVLRAESIETIDPEGESFDRHEQEAVGIRHSSEEKDGLVAEVIQVGYKQGNHVMRPARVLVYKSDVDAAEIDGQENSADREETED